MKPGTLGPIVRHLSQLACPAGANGTDGELLRRFIEQRDEVAFAALMRRHGPMVLGVCRRLLRHQQDAEDAFQATFLVLASRAAAVANRESVGSFLHGTALRVARKARGSASRRRLRVGEVADRPAPQAEPEINTHELREILDEEINRLPKHYRMPFVLCHLEGRTNEEAARLLGCPKGTILSRLARARRRLAHCLRRRGVSLGATMVTTMLTSSALRAAVHPSLLSTTSRIVVRVAAGQTAASAGVSAGVLALTGKGIESMLMTRTKMALAVLLGVAMLGTGAGVLRHQALSQTTAAGGKEPARKLSRAVTPTARPEPGKRKDEGKPPVAESRLQEVLRNWAQASEAVRQVRYQITEKVVDHAFERTDTFRLRVALRKPDLIRVDRFKAGGKLVEIALCEGKNLHLYSTKTRTHQVYRIPTDYGFPILPKRFPDTFVGRLFGGTLEQAAWVHVGFPVRDLTTRFKIRLAVEDRWYCYLDVRPRTREDRKRFERMRIVLLRDSWQVRQVWFQDINSEHTLDYLRVDTSPSPPITRESITRGLPKNYKRLEVPAAPW